MHRKQIFNNKILQSTQIQKGNVVVEVMTLDQIFLSVSVRTYVLKAYIIIHWPEFATYWPIYHIEC